MTPDGTVQFTPFANNTNGSPPADASDRRPRLRLRLRPAAAGAPRAQAPTALRVPYFVPT
ncbi:hypothetical protein GCM10010206_00910 [Streptomyces cinerochromogenes]|nr:hypothetical protein GCM10010206_00910 [Streptomyces cinerochromogenes]